jgi:hypothetical protein
MHHTQMRRECLRTGLKMTRPRRLAAVTLILLVTGTAQVVAAESTISPKGIKFFEYKIRPVLVEHCYKCHSLESGKAKGGLVLDTRDGLTAGGERGPAIVPGKPGTSLLLAAISHSDPDLEMPPKKARLSDTIISNFKNWIAMGAPDPRIGPAPIALKPSNDADARNFWAFKKPTPPSLPETSNPAWARRELDRFILAKLDDKGISPSPDADPATLLRRLHFDLVGLPPAPTDQRRFDKRIADAGFERALAAEVDALLASERFGERWGRHWLDVARYAESSGKDTNVTFPHAWRYRDYVIDAFNSDKPFDRFITEQIAGDLLPFANNQERERLLIATGFLAIGPKGLNEMNPLQFRADLIDEQIDSVTRAVTATTVACARCHDHKYDPFSMEDYYGLAGIFRSTKTFYGTRVAPGNQRGGDFVELPRLKEQHIPNKSVSKKRVAKLKADLAAVNKEEKDSKAAAMKAALEGRDPEKFFNIATALRIIWKRGGLEGQLKTVDDDGRALPLAMGVLDRKQIADAPLLERGEIKRPGAKIPRGFPWVIPIETLSTISNKQSGRLELAAWLTHPDQPLTSRVMANRVWRHLFGAGIVPTMDNFGVNGARPSHPEALDHLALRFVDNGWSVKSLVREIVLSRSYRQSSAWREDAFKQDPDNRLLWRASKRRLDAEAIRDAMLAVSGNLDLNRPEGSLIANLGPRPVSLIAFAKNVPLDLDGSSHRSVYLPVVRDRLPDALDLFDFAEPSLVTGDRETTNVPVQALYLMNSPFIREQAQGFARRIASEAKTPAEQTRLAFALCFNRVPDSRETELGKKFFQQASKGNDSQLALTTYCQALLATAEFRNLD